MTQTHKYDAKGPRKDCQEQLRDNKNNETWRAARQELIERRARGRQAKRKGTGQGRTKVLKSKQARQARLVTPGAKFWPLHLYEQKFGNPKSTENHKGHRISTMGGFKGVIVPAEKKAFDQPWDVEVGYLDELALEDELEKKGSDDESDFSQELETKYADMAAQDCDLLPLQKDIFP